MSVFEMALLDRCAAFAVALAAGEELEARVDRADAEPEGWHRAAKPRRPPSEPNAVNDIVFCARSVYRTYALVSGFPTVVGGRWRYRARLVSGWAVSRWRHG